MNRKSLPYYPLACFLAGAITTAGWLACTSARELAAGYAPPPPECRVVVLSCGESREIELRTGRSVPLGALACAEGRLTLTRKECAP